MILFTLPHYEPMAAALTKALPGLSRGEFRVGRFDNGELNAAVRTAVAAEPCMILGSIAPPDEQLFSALLLAHTLKKEGAETVTALLPYLAYSRQDKDTSGESLGAALVGRLLKSAGFDRVITADVHSAAGKRLCGVPIVSLDTATLFGDAIQRYRLTDASIVAPDHGAIPRAKAVRAAAGMENGDVPYFEKRRTAAGIEHAGPLGKVGPRAVIVDDILDTGATLVSACEKLEQAGVREIYVMVTHGLFTGDRWKQLWRLGVQRIVCTDTLPLPGGLDTTNIDALSIAPILRQELLYLEEHENATAHELS